MDIIDWSDFVQLGPEPLSSGPGVSSSGGRLDVFVSQSPDRALWLKTYDGSTWFDYQPIKPNACLSPPLSPRSPLHLFEFS
jgi:hypothetical protein